MAQEGGKMNKEMGRVAEGIAGFSLFTGTVLFLLALGVGALGFKIAAHGLRKGAEYYGVGGNGVAHNDDGLSGDEHEGAFVG